MNSIDYILDNQLINKDLFDYSNNYYIDNNDILYNNELNDDFENILNEMNENLILYRYKTIFKIPYNYEQFIKEFPKDIFFKNKNDILEYFSNNDFNLDSTIWIIYNQVYICNIINNIYFNDFLEKIFFKYKENINFYSIKDILNFILDSKYNFLDNLLKCKKFYEEIYIEDLNLSVENVYVKNSLEDVD